MGINRGGGRQNIGADYVVAVVVAVDDLGNWCGGHRGYGRAAERGDIAADGVDRQDRTVTDDKGAD